MTTNEAVSLCINQRIGKDTQKIGCVKGEVVLQQQTAEHIHHSHACEGMCNIFASMIEGGPTHNCTAAALHTQTATSSSVFHSNNAAAAVYKTTLNKCVETCVGTTYA